MSVLLSVSLAVLVGAPTPPQPPNSARLAELVRKLGDKSYRTREYAARELLRGGSASVAALTEGTKHTDPEVSERCRQLLPQAAAVERNEKLAALAKDPSAPPPKGLAGLERFLKVTGDDKASRELYAEMLAIHHRTIEAAETNPKEAGEQYRQFCDEAYNRFQAGARVGRYSYDNMFSSRADITFFLFISADTRVRKNDAGVNRSSVLLYGNQLSNAITAKESSQAMRKLFLDWLENEPQTYLQQRGFQIAAQANIKEALPVVLRLLEKPGKDTYGKAQVMTSLVKLGSKEQIKLLDPYLADTNHLTTINFGNGQEFKVQVRDVAMGVQIQLAGEKMTDYGYDNRFGGGWASYHYYGFATDQARDEAHAKWKEFAKKNLAKDTDKSDKKAPEAPKGEVKPMTPKGEARPAKTEKN